MIQIKYYWRRGGESTINTIREAFGTFLLAVKVSEKRKKPHHSHTNRLCATLGTGI